MNKTFNIFEVLSKHDKELSHSAFIRFLLDQEDGFFLEKLFGEKGKKYKICLEVKLKKANRIDILLESDTDIIAIENKFKYLPSVVQLNNYTIALNEKFPGRQIKKIVFYFSEGSNFSLPDDWSSITYSDLYDHIIEYLKSSKNICCDKRILIEHYSRSLEYYIDKYKHLKDPKRNILKDHFSKNKENKFWLTLMFHELAHHFKSLDYETWVGAGGTYMPVMNIHLDAWKSEINGTPYEFVIQLNGKNLKYYAHLKGIENKQSVIEQEIQRLKNAGFQERPSGKFKNKVSIKSNTCYIYQEDLLTVMEQNNDLVSLENIQLTIQELISKIADSHQAVPAIKGSY